MIVESSEDWAFLRSGSVGAISRTRLAGALGLLVFLDLGPIRHRGSAIRAVVDERAVLAALRGERL